MSKKTEIYITSLVIFIVIPLLPLLASMLLNNYRYNELVLTAAMFPISLFVSSKSQLLFGLALAALILFSICLSYKEENNRIEVIAWLTIAAVILIHAVERYIMHVRNNEKVFNFN